MSAGVSPVGPSPKARSGPAIDGLVIGAVLLGLWQATFLYAGDAALASPLATFSYLGSLLGTANFWDHFAATMKAFVYALAISGVLGILVGLVLGMRRFAGDVAEPILAGLYSVPKVTLYPMILLIFGLGIGAKVAFGVIHGIVPVILFTLSAVKNVSPVLVRTARAMRLTPSQTIATVLAPAVLPEMATGLRVGFSLTLLGVLIGEMFASQKGLGFLIVNGMNLHNVKLMTAIIVVVIGFAVAANGLLLWIDHRLARRG